MDCTYDIDAVKYYRVIKKLKKVHKKIDVNYSKDLNNY